MNEPNPPAPPTDSRPTDSEIASLLEGKLERAERERVLAGLRADPESFAIFAEAADFLAEDDAAEAPAAEKAVADVVPLDSRRRGPAAQWLGGLAAAALLAVFFLLPVLTGPGVSLVASVDLLSPVTSTASADDLASLSPLTALGDAAPAFSASADVRQRGVRYGALTVDLALAGAAGLSSLQATLAREILDSSSDLRLSGADAGALLRASQGEGIPGETIASLERELAKATEVKAFEAGQRLQALHVAAAGRARGQDLAELGRGALESLEALGAPAPASLDELRGVLAEEPVRGERIAPASRMVLLELLR